MKILGEESELDSTGDYPNEEAGQGPDPEISALARAHVGENSRSTTRVDEEIVLRELAARIMSYTMQLPP